MSDAARPVNENTPASWWVQVRGQAYGPYTLDQMIGFISEGRVRPYSMVAQAQNGEWAEARNLNDLMGAFRVTSFVSAKQSEEAANIFVYAEINSGAYIPFTAALEGFGAICKLTPNLYLVRTALGAGVIRNTLSQTLERGDRFIVIDSSRDRFAWFNLGPEIDVKIKDVWNAPLRESTAPTR